MEYTPYIPQQINPQQQLEQSGKDLAIASLAVSVSCLFMSLGLLSFIGAILGHISLGKLKAAGSNANRNFAIWGIILGYAFTALFFIVIFFVILFLLLSDSYYY